MEPGESTNQLTSVAPWKLWTERILRWGLGVIFVYAAYSKIWNPQMFAEEVSYYHMLPMQQVNWLVIFLPWLEMICGLALIFGVSHRGATILVIGMLIVFTYAIAHAVHEGRDIQCGCFGHGASAERVGYLAIVRDLVMLVAAVTAFLLSRRGSHVSVKRA
jgi:uncharacterized membrane protein YphA (DoxX/SURF4 family)